MILTWVRLQPAAMHFQTILPPSSHRMLDRPTLDTLHILSRKQNETTRNLTRRDRLSLVYGIKKFHSYLLGHHFELITDHKPLLGLLKEDRATSSQASARIKHWSLFLFSYEYTLAFRDTKAHTNADALTI